MRACIVIILAVAGVALSVTAFAGLKMIDKEEARAVVDNMTFVRDHRSGLCFGVTKSWVAAGAFSNNSIYSTTLVPCDKVEKFLVE